MHHLQHTHEQRTLIDHHTSKAIRQTKLQRANTLSIKMSTPCQPMPLKSIQQGALVVQATAISQSQPLLPRKSKNTRSTNRRSTSLSITSPPSTNPKNTNLKNIKSTSLPSSENTNLHMSSPRITSLRSSHHSPNTSRDLPPPCSRLFPRPASPQHLNAPTPRTVTPRFHRLRARRCPFRTLRVAQACRACLQWVA